MQWWLQQQRLAVLHHLVILAAAALPADIGIAGQQRAVPSDGPPAVLWSCVLAALEHRGAAPRSR